MARKRADDLLVDAIGWLDDSGVVADRVGSVGEIVTYGQVGAADVDDLAPVTVAVTVIPGASNRQNRREEKTMTVEVEVSASNTWIGGNTTLALARLLGDIKDVLTTHRDGWTAGGQSGGTAELSPDADRPRYSGVRRYDFSRNDTAAYYDTT